MNQAFFRLLSLFLMVTIMSGTISNTKADSGKQLPGYFVSTEWLVNHLADEQLRIVQVGGDGFYFQSHIPGAVLLPNNELVTTRDGVPGMRPEPGQMAFVFGRLGIGNRTKVVAYDASGGMDAARLIWTLHSLGHQQGAVLDGGFPIWLKEERVVTNRVSQPEPATFIPQAIPEFEVNWHQVEAISENKQPGILLDTRTWREYVGITLGSPRGHIGGAVHMDWIDSLVSPKEPLLKPLPELEAMLAQVGLTDKRQQVVVYCQTAHRASQTWILLRHLGYTNVRLYDGSIAEWRMLDLPQVMGESPR
ncbi:MAG: sulfurtransferase [Magnetococcales bacterium]|nr:sulfurtransferase [Magnetococcales bacterium]NGZ26654.1 sulfurtransferase [Magnetococcales bacterium]